MTEILTRRGFGIESGIPRETLACPDGLAPTHDLYLLKSYTALSLRLAGVLHVAGVLSDRPTWRQLPDAFADETDGKADPDDSRSSA